MKHILIVLLSVLSLSSFAQVGNPLQKALLDVPDSLKIKISNTYSNLIDEKEEYVHGSDLKTYILNGICDKLSTYPNGSYSSQKFLSVGSGSQIPPTWVGFEFDYATLFTSCGGNSNIADYYFMDFQHCGQSTPVTHISVLDAAAVQAFIDNTLIPDLIACGFSVAVGDIIYTVVGTTIVVWYNPSYNPTNNNFVFEYQSNGGCEKQSPSIPSTLQSGSSCELVVIPTICEQVKELDFGDYVAGDTLLAIGASFSGQVQGWDVTNGCGNGGICNLFTAGDNYEVTFGVNGTFPPNLTGTYSTFDQLITALNAYIISNWYSYQLANVGLNQVYVVGSSGSSLPDVFQLHIFNVTQSVWIAKDYEPTTITILQQGSCKKIVLDGVFAPKKYQRFNVAGYTVDVGMNANTGAGYVNLSLLDLTVPAKNDVFINGVKHNYTATPTTTTNLSYTVSGTDVSAFNGTTPVFISQIEVIVNK